MEKRKIIGISTAILTVFALTLFSYDAVKMLLSAGIDVLDIVVLASSIVLAQGIVRLKKVAIAYAAIMYLSGLTIATINSGTNFAYMLNLGFFIVTTLWVVIISIRYARGEPIE